MNIFKDLQDDLKAVILTLSEAGKLPADLDLKNVTVEPPRDVSHGDMATNAAMVLTKQTRMKPRDVAELIKGGLEKFSRVAGVEIAGPGFINVRFKEEYILDQLKVIFDNGANYGRSNLGGGEKVNVEYVSVNPTGPLHVGHCRGAIFGDALASLLKFSGHNVTKEYYVNDAGGQIDVLARSAYLRYKEALGEKIEIPEGLYPGDYLKPVGEALAKAKGDIWLKADEDIWLTEIRKFATDAMMDMIRADLETLDIKHDVFFSESTLHKQNDDIVGIDEAMQRLEDRNYLYVGVLDAPKGKLPDDWEERPQTLFKSTDFGDDVDRAVKKSNGEWTYFAADVAYHNNKIERGFNQMINVWGADHGGYVKRVQAVVEALHDGRAHLDVKLCQMVKLLRDGIPAKMSKRSGNFITMRDIVNEVGKDVVRFIMLTRKNDANLDFDFAKVTEQSKDNPVFYVQYAHARVHSVLRKAKEQGIEVSETSDVDLSALNDSSELGLIKEMLNWPRLMESAAVSHEPHRIAFYLYDLASEFHALWNKGNGQTDLRFIIDGDIKLTMSRLYMIKAFAAVIASGLNILGVKPLEEM
jgi:arginyl-tRNA synthetase